MSGPDLPHDDAPIGRDTDVTPPRNESDMRTAHRGVGQKIAAHPSEVGAMTDELQQRLDSLRNEFHVRELTTRGGAQEIAALEDGHLRAEMAVLAGRYGPECAEQVWATRPPRELPPAWRAGRAVSRACRALSRLTTDWIACWLEISGMGEPGAGAPAQGGEPARAHARRPGYPKPGPDRLGNPATG